jgi:YD repeat-containing protein
MNQFYLNFQSSYDAQGNVRVTDVYTYDQDGKLTQEHQPHDGFSSSTNTYTYNASGNLATKTSVYYGKFSSGLIIYYAYDANDNLATETYNYDNDGVFNDDFDGTADTIITYIYDNHRNLITKTYDSYADGTPETTTTYIYDQDGNLSKEIYDSHVEMGSDEITTYSYDANANLTNKITESDNDNNEVLDQKSLYRYTYNTSGNLITETFDYNDDGIDSVLSYTYDDHGNLITKSKDEEADGIVDRIWQYHYIQADELRVIKKPRMLLTEVHRFYQSQTGSHLYTPDLNEVNYIKEKSSTGELSYNYEAEKYAVLADNYDTLTGEVIEEVKPIYRFFNTDTGAHLYTMDENEKSHIQDSLDNYNFEGIKYYAFESEPNNIETIPVYRMLNTQSGKHLFSNDQNEINYVEQNLPHFEMENNGDAAFYVLEL